LLSKKYNQSAFFQAIALLRDSKVQDIITNNE